MRFLDLAYGAGLAAISPVWIYKMLRHGKYRAGLRERLCGPRPRPKGVASAIWVHAVSVGEVLSARPVVAALGEAYAESPVLVSTTTETGQEVARKHFGEAFYYPLDFSFSVRGAFDAIRPRAVVLMELEIWPNFLAEAKKRGVPVAVANGRISGRSFRRFRAVGSFARSLLDRVDAWAVQTEAYADRLVSLGVPAERVEVVGSLKFDAVEPGSDEERRLAERARLTLAADALVLVGGSTHRGEERALLAAYSALRAEFPALRLVLVPRHPERYVEVEAEIRRAGFASVRKTTLGARGASPLGRGEILLVDTMGELAAVYGAADAVFVGGSFVRRGGQNMIEPAAHALPVLFGPHTFNFAEPVEKLLACGGAVRVASETALQAALARLLASPEERRRIGDAGRACVERERGATARNLAVLRRAIDRAPVPSKDE